MRAGFCMLLLSAGVCLGAHPALPTPGKAASFEVSESPSDLVVSTPQYKLTVNRLRFGVRIERNGELVLESAPPMASGEIGATSLETYSRTQEGLRLNYQTGQKGVVALIDVEPCDDAIRFTTSILGGVNASPSFRYSMASSGLWYGGGFQGFREPQVFPLNQANIRPRYFFAEGTSQGTPVWYTTKGVAVWIRTPQDFRYSTNTAEAGKGAIFVVMPGVTSLTHDVVLAPNGAAVVGRIIRSIGLPKTIPPAEYFRLPVYTTWVEHKADVSQQKVLEFAKEIRGNRLPAGVIEIDDKWESRYGDMTFDKAKFPDPKAMTAELHKLGYRVTLWVHPFVNLDSATYGDPNSHALMVHDSNGRPGLLRWWNGLATAWDFTDTKAAAEFRARLKRLQDEYGMDGFKFDGADAHLLPRDLVTDGAISPVEYQDVYNREVTGHFPWNETRVGAYSQSYGVVQRLQDKNSVWGLENGLASTVPEALTVSLRGFFFVMPDIIGGNQYDGDTAGKELMIRWAQASALMPFMQFSLGPWRYDAQTIHLIREASEVHIRFTPLILRLAQAAVRDGDPILRPIWYNFPDDVAAQSITDQFMLGNDVVVAPVLTNGATSRNLYLPAGAWKDLKTGKPVEGGRWLNDYPAPLDTLPVFVRSGANLGF